MIILKNNKERVEIRMPKPIIEKLDKYQEENGLSTRTATILELLRKGLEK
ncbi:ribbon-helix-helix domain-containing protein [Metalysinibacillus jejuensis]|nr:ribbon-helix-helix domain-containing protein [Metalysinibacillus jejuensis]